MSKLIVSKVITATSPIHITEPGKSHWDPDRAAFTSVGGFACSRTKRLRVAVPSGGNGASDVVIPYLPGNSLRCGMRRRAAVRLENALVSRGETGDVDLYHVIMCGAASGSPDKGVTAPSKYAEALKNPFVALFAGGPGMIWSCLSEGNGFPITKETIAAHMVPESFGPRSVDGSALTSVVMFPHIDDLLRGTGKLPRMLADPAGETAEWLKSLSEDKAAKAAAKAAKKAGTKVEDSEEDKPRASIATLSAREFVIPGVTFYSEDFLDTEVAGPAMFGIYILGLCDWANAQRLGGCAREGFGRFRLEATASNGDGSSFPILGLRDGVYVVDMSSPVVVEAVEAAEKFYSEVSAARMRKDFLL